MDEHILKRVAKIIAPYLKTKHKEKESLDIAKKVLEEMDDISQEKD
jgi:hypothetical protein